MTSAPVVDETKHWDAFKALLTEPLGIDSATNEQRVYGYGMVPGFPGIDPDGTRPNIFVLLSISRRPIGPRKAAGFAGRSAWQIAVRGVGRNDDEARWALSVVDTELDEIRVTIDGFRSTRLANGQEQLIGPDGDRFSGLKTWSYVL